MRKLILLPAIILVGIGTALTYTLLENAAHFGIDLIWYDWLDTDDRRILVVPLAIVLSLVFFGAQHLLDRKSESGTEEGLGNMPAPTVAKYCKILLLGFLSLIAGASLGPEAILVPACMVLGAMVGKKISDDRQIVGLLTAAAITALFAAFFHSLLVGILSVALVIKQAKTNLSIVLLATASLASAASWLTLRLIDGESYAKLPPYDWEINASTVLISLVLVAAGYVVIFGMKHVEGLLSKLRDKLPKKNSWWIKALVASAGISILYLLGGPLVEFTGNRSIVPMFDQAAALGLAGLLWVLAVKIVVIAWSKTIGYRGGMIFPVIFLATVLVAVVQLYVKDFNMIYGLIAVLIGAFIANSTYRILA